jgi:hypothetical protein
VLTFWQKLFVCTISADKVMSSELLSTAIIAYIFCFEIIKKVNRHIIFRIKFEINVFAVKLLHVLLITN